MEPEKQNTCYRRCRRNKKKRLRIKKRQAKRLEEMLRPALDSLSQLCISQPSTSRLGTTETGLPSLAQLYISQTPLVQRPPTTSNQSGIPSLMQLCLPSFMTQEQPMHFPLPITPPPPSPIQRPLSISPPPPQPPPPSPIQPPLPTSPPPTQPPPPSPIQPPLPTLPPPTQPPPPPYDPPGDDNGNSGVQAIENNNCVTYTPNILATTYEANLNFLRHYSQYYSMYSGLQN